MTSPCPPSERLLYPSPQFRPHRLIGRNSLSYGPQAGQRGDGGRSMMRTWALCAITVGVAVTPLIAQQPLSGPVAVPVPNPPVPPPPAEPVLPYTTCPKDSECERGWSVFVEGDYLYVKPRGRNQDFVIVDPHDDGRIAGSIDSLNWDWRSAFRVGGGVQFNGGWEAAFYYGYLHDATRGGVQAPDGGVLFATLTHPGTVDQVASALAATSFNYNVYDLELARSFNPTDTFSLRLFGGLRAAHIDQNFNALYDGVTANQDFVSSRVRFDGVGARIGGEGNWHPGNGLGLYARGSAALVLGDFRTHLSEVNNAGTTVLVDVSDCFDRVVPVLELG